MYVTNVCSVLLPDQSRDKQTGSPNIPSSIFQPENVLQGVNN